MRWLLNLWRWQQRRVDLAILWPSCKSAARDSGAGLDAARSAFAMHAFRDTAWTALGEDEIRRRIDALS
jgi:hypothetical protein